MLLYNPNDSNIYSKEYREERNKILMNRMLKLHIQKLQLQKWEHGKPVELAADDFSYFIKYEDGSIYQYYDYEYGINVMELYKVSEDDFIKVKEEHNYEN